MERQTPDSTRTADEQFLRPVRAQFTDTDPWRVLRITSEFVEGFDALADVEQAVTVFGSSRVGATLYEDSGATARGAPWRRSAWR